MLEQRKGTQLCVPFVFVMNICAVILPYKIGYFT